MHHPHRSFLTALAIAGMLVAGQPASPAAAAGPAAALACAPGTPVLGDYDGDGAADLAVSAVVSENPGNFDLSYDSFEVVPADGGAPYWVEGSHLSAADLDGDICSDAVVSTAPNIAAPLVTLLSGSPSGLNRSSRRTFVPPQLDPRTSWYQLQPAVALRHDGISQVVVAGAPDGGPSFVDVYTLDAEGDPGVPQVITGGTIAAAKFWCSYTNSVSGWGRTVAIGACYDDEGAATRAGAVYLFSFDSANELVFRTRITQASAGVPGIAEANDFFGESLSYRDGHLAIGAPQESIGKAKETGLVQPILWNEVTSSYTALREIHQGMPGVPGSNESGDRFGNTVQVTRGLVAPGSWDIAIGASREGASRSKPDSGSFTLAGFSGRPYRAFTQKTRRIPGTLEAGDMFGTVAVLSRSASTDVLVVGARGENVKGCDTTGYVARSNGRPLASAKWTMVPTPSCSAWTVQAWGSDFAR